MGRYVDSFGREPDDLCEHCSHPEDWHDEPGGACWTNWPDATEGIAACDCEGFVPQASASTREETIQEEADA